MPETIAPPAPSSRPAATQPPPTPATAPAPAAPPAPPKTPTPAPPASPPEPKPDPGPSPAEQDRARNRPLRQRPVPEEPPKVDPAAAADNDAAWRKILTRDFKDMLPPEPESEAKPDDKKAEPDAPAAPAAKAEDKTPAAPADSEPKPAKVSRKSNADLENVIQETIRKEMSKLPLPEKAPAPAKPAEEKKSEPDLTGWMPEEIEALELAQFAETTQPERYKGQAAKVVQFRKALNDYIENGKKADPERTFDGNDEEFSSWVEKNKPSYQPGDTAKLERQRIETSAVKRAKAEVQADLDKQQDEIKALRFEPTIDRQIKTSEQAMVRSVSEDPFLKENLEQADKLGDHLARAQEIGIDKVASELPLPDRIAVTSFHLASNAGKELLKLEYQTKKWNPEDPTHRWLGQFVQIQDQVMSQLPKTDTMRDGKQFIPRSEFQRVATERPELAGNYWTWTTADLLQMLALNAQSSVTSRIKNAITELEKAGWKRTPKAAPIAANPQPTIERSAAPTPKSPKASSPISPGAATESGKATVPGAMPQSYLRARGYIT
jgi:hypothetical protein